MMRALFSVLVLASVCCSDAAQDAEPNELERRYLTRLSEFVDHSGVHRRLRLVKADVCGDPMAFYEGAAARVQSLLDRSSAGDASIPPLPLGGSASSRLELLGSQMRVFAELSEEQRAKLRQVAALFRQGARANGTVSTTKYLDRLSSWHFANGPHRTALSLALLGGLSEPHDPDRASRVERFLATLVFVEDIQAGAPLFGQIAAEVLAQNCLLALFVRMGDGDLGECELRGLHCALNELRDRPRLRWDRYAPDFFVLEAWLRGAVRGEYDFREYTGGEREVPDAEVITAWKMVQESFPGFREAATSHNEAKLKAAECRLRDRALACAGVAAREVGVWLADTSEELRERVALTRRILEGGIVGLRILISLRQSGDFPAGIEEVLIDSDLSGKDAVNWKLESVDGERVLVWTGPTVSGRTPLSVPLK